VGGNVRRLMEDGLNVIDVIWNVMKVNLLRQNLYFYSRYLPNYRI